MNNSDEMDNGTNELLIPSLLYNVSIIENNITVNSR